MPALISVFTYGVGTYLVFSMAMRTEKGNTIALALIAWFVLLAFLVARIPWTGGRSADGMGLLSASGLHNAVMFFIFAFLCFDKEHKRIGALCFIIGGIELIDAFF